MSYPGKKSYDLWSPGQKDKTTADVSQGCLARNDERQPDGDGKQGEESERGNWDNKAEFVLSCIGMSVGLGNVWRFPYLAYENGGAAFLIAYLVLQLLVGKPLYLMELVMAQYSNLGPTKVWALNPLAKGVGISMCIISLVVAIYYNVIMAYTLFYFFSSMQKTLPWTVCQDHWENCITERTRAQPDPCTDNVTLYLNMTTPECECVANTTINDLQSFNCTPAYKTSTELFFYKDVIEISEGVEPGNMGAPLWRLALCLLLSWIVVVLCLIKGIKSSGKVVYFTATFPYVILIILLIRGSLLDGAIDGVKFFIIPDWDKLLEIDVWVAAAGQMFFSLSVSFGGIIMFGSYNKFDNNVYGDALLISIMDLVTSVIAGFVVFTTFGGMAKTIGTTVDKVAKSGYGLAFVAYPEALTNLPPPQLWSVLFFFMLFTLGLDSEFGLMETILTCIQDEAPKLRKYKSQMCLGFGVVCYFLALPCVCPGGDYVVTLMDHYGADFSVLILACFEVISVMWVYGVMRFLGDMTYMLGQPSRPIGWPYWVFTWAFAAPIIIAMLFLYRMIQYNPPTYDKDVPFPLFAQAIGWTLLCIVLCPVPLWAIFHAVRTFRKHPGLSIGETFSKMIEPTKEWKPSNGSTRSISEISLDKIGVDNPAMTASDPAPYYNNSSNSNV
ncbi:sodium- and chloride-dependent neutral and basic amino acid transporter B(0+)-like isoform X2 [Littorina saxatilis]|uniref:sodium- and chloride-dependent neutral and basic amino acid transporter B(0+)-like isoform X2 n=1 Tax=Littorina saxatilis TaxID=31220 RepID=UPI0038B53F09